MDRFDALGADCWRGWVPTVLTALSISLIGRRTTRRVGAANAVVGSRRYIVATQRRGIIPLDHAEADIDAAMEAERAPRVRMTFLATSTAGEDDRFVVRGRVHVFLIRRHWRRRVNNVAGRRSPKEAFRTLRGALTGPGRRRGKLADLLKWVLRQLARLLPGSPRIPISDTGDFFWQTAQLFDEECSAAFDFELAQDGVCAVAPVGADLFSYEGVWRLLRLGVPVDTTDSLPEEFRRLEAGLLQQAFLFIKDLAHYHQHHEPGGAAITLAFPVRYGARDEWAVRNYRSMLRRAVRLKAWDDAVNVATANGIIAYARSFERIAERRAIRLPLRALDNARLSIDARIEATSTIVAQQGSTMLTLANVFVAFVAVCVGLIGFLNLADQPFGDKDVTIHPWLVGGVALTLAHPLKAMLTLAVIGLLLVYLINKRWVRKLRLDINVKIAHVIRFIAESRD